MTDRPTPVELADAVMRFCDEVDAATAAIGRASDVLRERKERGASGMAGPLFPYVGGDLYERIDKARALLWESKKTAAPQFLSARREIDQATHA